MTESEQASPKGAVTKVALLFGGCTYNINVTVFAVSISAIGARFGADTEMLSTLTNLPALFMIPAVLISAWLARNVSKKDVLLAGWLIFMASGLLAILSSGITMMLVSRAMTGFAIGLMSSIPRTMIAQMYPQQISRMNGLQTSATTAVSFTCSLAAGYLAAMGWHYPIYLFFLGILFFALVILFVPRVPPEKTAYSGGASGSKLSFGTKAWLTALAGSCLFLLFVPVQTKLTLVILSRGGDVVMAGYARMVMTMGSVAGGFVFAFLAKKSRNVVILIALAVSAAGYYLIAAASSLALLFVGIFFAGLASLGMTLPWFGSQLAMTVDRSKVMNLMSAYTVMNYLCQFLTTYVVSGFESLAGNSAPTTSLFGVSVCLAGALALACALVAVSSSKKKKEAA